MADAFDTKHYLSLPDAEAQAYLDQHKQAGPPGEAGDGGEAMADEGGEAPEEEQAGGDAEQAPAEGGEGGPQQPARETMVRYEAMHEERMKRREAEAALAEAKAKLAQLESQQPAPAAAAPPVTPVPEATPAASGLLFEAPEAISAVVQSAIDAHPDMQELRQLRQEKADQAAAQAIAAKYEDPEAPALIARLDQVAPAYKAAGLPPEARYFMAKGVAAASPEAKAQAQAAAQAAGREMAVTQKAEQLSQKAAAAPATPNLAGIPPAAANGPTPDGSRMSAKDLLSAPQAQLDAMRRGRAS